MDIYYFKLLYKSITNLTQQAFTFDELSIECVITQLGFWRTITNDASQSDLDSRLDVHPQNTEDLSLGPTVFLAIPM